MAIESHLDSLYKSIDSVSSKYDTFILLGDFNSCMEYSRLKTFAEIYKLRNLMKEPTAFKNHSYWKYKDFHNETFLDSLRHELNVQGQFLNEKGIDAFSTICTELFDKHAPKKSDIYYITISLSLIMMRSRLRNHFLKNRVKKIENYFANKEISAFHFCENQKRIISKT